MALNRTLENRWIRRYKTFFVFGFLILIIQLYIAVKFFTLHAKDINELSSNDKQKFDNVFDSLGTDEHSARHTKEETNLDDEDTAVNSNSVNIYKHEPDKLLDVKIIVKNKTVLRVEELNFVPLCDIGSKDAISAIHRAKTQNCKQLIANITCLIQDGQLYPVSLDNYCPHKDLHAGRSLGCYKDEKTFRLLSGYYANYKLNNSPEHCIRMCLQSGFVYAGVQYSTECFCGNDQPPSTARLPDPSCNMKCPANPRKACGGYFTINIYETGIAAFTPQQAELITSSKNQVRIAYLLTLNGRAVRQVKRLIKALFHIDHYFYIHIDARQDYMYRELLTLEKKYSNIKLARKRYATIWGGASLLQMLLNSMSDLLKKSDWKWDFVINLSESDFPVKSTDKLVEFLTANRGKNFVKSHGREVQRFIQKQGLDKTFIECDAHMWRTGDRQLPWGIQIDGGSDWIALSRDFIKYVTSTNPDNLINGLLNFFRYTLLPAESFFHTVLRNSQFCNTYIDNNLHVTNWKRKLGCKCQYKHVVDWCGCSPNDFKPDDWQRILATESKQLYFARKFEPVVNQAIILQLEDWLYGPHYLNVTNINSYWQSVYHSADISPSPDDVIHTISNSILRILSKQLSAQKCSIVSHELIEVTSYFSKDLFQGSILTYNFNSTLKMETKIKYQSNILISKNNNSLLKRLKSFYVSSEYDQKEQISRNFGRFLGPFSEPVIIYEFLPNINNNANKYNNITFVWVNPSGDVVDIGHAHIETNYVINSVKLQLKGPLLPGIWTIKLVHDKIILAQSVFLVTPLEFIAKNPLTNTQSVMIHSGGGTITSVSKKVTKDWLKYGKSLNDRHMLKSSSLTNAKRIGIDLQEWIDTLVSKFYKIDGTCIYLIADKKVNNPFLCNNILKFESCSNMLWSTFSPDPKSDISSINSMMQKLNLDSDSVR